MTMLDLASTIIVPELSFARPADWTTGEERILRENYPTLGGVGCAPLLPRHSVVGIQRRASLRRIAFTGKRVAWKRKIYSTTDHIDDLITRTYQGEPRRGQVKVLAHALQRPRWWVTQRAAQLGLGQVRVKEPDWSPAEIEIITEAASLCARSIVAKLKRAGYTRTANAVVLKLSRIGVERDGPEGYSTTGLAVLMGCDAKVISRWIEKGWLKASRRTRDNGGPGTAYSIHPPHLRRFIMENPGAVDIRKVDKLWFIDLLTGRL